MSILPSNSIRIRPPKHSSRHCRLNTTFRLTRAIPSGCCVSGPRLWHQVFGKASKRFMQSRAANEESPVRLTSKPEPNLSNSRGKCSGQWVRGWWITFMQDDPHRSSEQGWLPRHCVAHGSDLTFSTTVRCLTCPLQLPRAKEWPRGCQLRNPSPASPTTVAVKITDMLGEEVLISRLLD